MKRKLFAIIVGIIVVLFSLYPVKSLTDTISRATNGSNGPTGWTTLIPNYLASFLGAATVGWLVRKRGWLFSLFLLIAPQTALFPDEVMLLLPLALINISVLLIGGFVGEKMYEKFNQNPLFNLIKRSVMSVSIGIFAAIMSTYPIMFLRVYFPANLIEAASPLIFNIPYLFGAIVIGWLVRERGWLYAYPLVLIWLPGVFAQITYMRFAEVEFQQKIYFFSHYFLNIILLPIGGLIGEKLYHKLHPLLRKN